MHPDWLHFVRISVRSAVVSGCGQRRDCTLVTSHTHAGDAIYAPLWMPEMEQLTREYQDAIGEAVLTALKGGIDEWINDPACELSAADRASVVLAECFRCGRATGFAEKIGSRCQRESCDGRYIQA